MEIISVAELKIGMFVVEPDCPWTEFPFALQGFVVTTPDQISLFREKCRFVSIDRSRSQGEHYSERQHGRDRPLNAKPLTIPMQEEKSVSTGFFSESEQTKRKQRRRRFLDFLHSQQGSEAARELSRELTYIEPRYDQLSTSLQQAFDTLAMGKDVDLQSVREGVRDMSGSLARNPDAVMWIMRLKQRDEYAFDHAMDVAVTMMMVGVHIGWRGQRLLDLGMTGLLQDIGKVELPIEVLRKTEPLTPDERRLVNSHVASSLEILFSQASVASDVMLAVARHHERWDGSGYPQGLMFEQIGMAGEIAGIADSFCSMQRDKPYRSALGHQEALEELHNLRDKQFNPSLMEVFVQCVGLYPIGKLV